MIKANFLKLFAQPPTLTLYHNLIVLILSRKFEFFPVRFSHFEQLDHMNHFIGEILYFMSNLDWKVLPGKASFWQNSNMKIKIKI